MITSAKPPSMRMRKREELRGWGSSRKSSFLQLAAMSRSYGVKKDFGLQKEGGVFLPDQHEESGVASPSKYTSSYRSTMPAYDALQHRGRGVHGKLAISSGPEKEAGLHPSSVSSNAARDAGSSDSREATSPRTPSDGNESPRRKKDQKSRGWFGGRKDAKKNGGVPDSVIDGVVEGRNVTRSSPMLHVRRAMRSGEKDQFGRPQTVPDEVGDAEVLMHLSYDAPVDITKGKLNFNRKKEV